MEETTLRLNEDNLFGKIDPKSPPAATKVAQWWETVDEDDLKDPNRRSSASKESLCQWSIDAQSISSSCVRRRQKASRKERELRERMEQELRNRQRQERRQLKANVARLGRGEPVIQDRSKSKAARIREEAKHGTRLFLGDSVDSGSSVEFVMKAEGRKREIEDKRQDEKRTERFSAVLEPFQHESKNRPRIVLTQKPRLHQGIFGQGASSGEHLKKEAPIHPKKKMSRPRTDSSPASIIEFNPRLPPAAPKWPGRRKGDSQSSVTQYSHAKDSFEELENAEKRLRRVLESLSRSKERARRTQMQPMVCNTKAASYHESEDGHSAHSNARRRQLRLKLKPGHVRKGRDVAVQNSAGSEASGQHRHQAPKKADDGRIDTVPKSMDPPPLLAFNGNRPYQHANAWRAQHSRNEPDPIQLRQEMEDNGGINMRARESLVTARTRQLPREYFGNGQIPQWEVMPAEGDLPYSPHEYHLNLPNTHQPHDDGALNVPPYADEYAMAEETNDYAADYNDAPWFDTAYEEPAYDQQYQQGYYQDPYLDQAFDPYTMHQEQAMGEYDVSNLHAYQGERAVAADWFDQDGYQDEGSWCDKISEANELVPMEYAALPPCNDVRTAMQPTEEDLPGFWKPQL